MIQDAAAAAAAAAVPETMAFYLPLINQQAIFTPQESIVMGDIGSSLSHVREIIVIQWCRELTDIDLTRSVGKEMKALCLRLLLTPR